MSEKVDKGLERLNAILPLRSRQEKLEPSLRELHRNILDYFADTGTAPDQAVLSGWVDNVPEALKILSDNFLIVLDDADNVRGAYPFTAESRVHEVSINGNTAHAMCALDALAIGAMYGKGAEINSRCDVTDRPVHLRQNVDQILNIDEVGDVMFGINWQASSSCCSCADSLCTEMVFLIDSEAVEKWQSPDHENREVYSLPEAMEFAERFFKPLLA